jgi:hypothetical protein
LVESFKLVQRPLDEGPKPKSDKLRLTYIAPLSEGKSIGSERKTVLKGEPLIWRTKNQAKAQDTVQLKDSICFKSVEIGS